MTPTTIMLILTLPVLLLLGSQMLLSMKSGSRLLKWLPIGLAVLFLLAAIIMTSLTEGDAHILSSLLVGYGIFLLLICGLGKVIATSILKSARRPSTLFQEDDKKEADQDPQKDTEE